MLFSANFVRQEFREGFDIAKPLMKRHMKQHDAVRRTAAAQRPFFLTFRGSIYGTRSVYRAALPALHDPAHGIVVEGNARS